MITTILGNTMKYCNMRMSNYFYQMTGHVFRDSHLIHDPENESIRGWD
jgi:hypothetical protein